MLVNTKEVVRDFKNEPYKDEDGSDITIGIIVANTLGKDNESTDPMRSDLFSRKFYENDEVDINESDATFIKESVKKAKLYPGVTAAVQRALTEKTEEKEG